MPCRNGAVSEGEKKNYVGRCGFIRVYAGWLDGKGMFGIMEWWKDEYWRVKNVSLVCSIRAELGRVQSSWVGKPESPRAITGEVTIGY